MYEMFRNTTGKEGKVGAVKHFIYEPRSEKTGLRGFRPGPTKTELCSHRRWLEA